MSIETNVPHTSFPESRGGGTAATELPTVASAAPFDLLILRGASEMDAVSNRVEGSTKGALEIATEAIGRNRVALASVGRTIEEKKK